MQKRIMEMMVVMVFCGWFSALAQQAGGRPSGQDRITQNIERVKARLGDQLLTTPEAIIAAHIQAIGGRDALDKVRTLRYAGRNIGLGSEDRPIVRYYKKPFLLRQETPGRSGHLFSDGKALWMASNGMKREMTQSWAMELCHARIDFDFSDIQKDGVSYVYMGLVGFETEPHVFYLVKRTYADGFSEELHFSVDSGLLRIVKVAGKDSFRIYPTYKEVGGILFPTMWITTFNKLTPPHLFIVDEIKANESYEDAFFTEGQ